MTDEAFAVIALLSVFALGIMVGVLAGRIHASESLENARQARREAQEAENRADEVYRLSAVARDAGDAALAKATELMRKVGAL